MAERVDLDAAERVINRPHIIQLRDDDWTLMHPPACHPRLFACPLSRAATRDLAGAPKPSEMGEFFCDLRPNGRLRIGERAPDSEGIDWAALVAELRVARDVVEMVRPWPPLVCVDCYEAACEGGDGDEPCGCEDGCHAKDQAFREILATYDQATARVDPAAGHAASEGQT